MSILKKFGGFADNSNDMDNFHKLSDRLAADSEYARSFVSSFVDRKVAADKKFYADDGGFQSRNKSSDISLVMTGALTIGAAAAFVAAAPAAVVGAMTVGAYALAAKTFVEKAALSRYESIAGQSVQNVVSEQLKEKASLWDRIRNVMPLNSFSFDKQAGEILDNAKIDWSSRATIFASNEGSKKLGLR